MKTDVRLIENIETIYLRLFNATIYNWEKTQF